MIDAAVPGDDPAAVERVQILLRQVPDLAIGRFGFPIRVGEDALLEAEEDRAPDQRHRDRPACATRYRLMPQAFITVSSLERASMPNVISTLSRTASGMTK